MKEGDKVRSKVNMFYRGTYTIQKCFKTCCWVTADEPWVTENGTPYHIGSHIFKGIPYSVLIPA
jgi:hypothetical protein